MLISNTIAQRITLLTLAVLLKPRLLVQWVLSRLLPLSTAHQPSQK